MQPQIPVEEKPNNKFSVLQGNVPEEVRRKWEEEQNRIKQRIIDHDDHPWSVEDVRLICGVDLSANKTDPDLACAGLVVLDVRDSTVVYEDFQVIKISQPYIPGFLAFREVPVLFQMFMRLRQKRPQAWPHLVMIDGNGILHSNGCGLACHLGVLLDTPTLGVGKTVFYVDGLDKGKVRSICDDQLKQENDFAYLEGESGRVWGAGLRNGKNTKNPVYVSTGTKISLQTAIQCVILSSEYRVPEPIRLADKKSRQIADALDPTADRHMLKEYDMVYLPQ